MDHSLFGIFLGVLMISALLAVCRLVLNALVFGPAPGRRAIREAHHSVVARQAVQDIDGEYEELLRS